MTAETYLRLKKQLNEETYLPPSMVEAVEFRRNAYELNKNQMAVLLGISIYQYTEFLYGNHTLSVESRRRAGVIGVPLSVLLAQPVAAEKPEPQLVYQIRYDGETESTWHDVSKDAYYVTLPNRRRAMLMEVPEADVADYENALVRAEPGSPASVYIKDSGINMGGEHWPVESVPGEATFHKKLVALGMPAKQQGYVMGAYRDTLADVPQYEEVGQIVMDGYFIKKHDVPSLDCKTLYAKKA